MIARCSVVAVLASLLAFGQLDSNSVTVTASRTLTSQADQVQFKITVDTGFDQSLTDVLVLVGGLGITAANLYSVGTAQVPIFEGRDVAPALEWAFILTAPVSRMKETISQLTAAQQNIARVRGVALQFEVQGLQVSQQVQQNQSCSYADLISDARAQAQRLAAAATMNLGVILALSANAPTISQGSTPVSYYASPYYTSPCSLTVKFGLSRY